MLEIKIQQSGMDELTRSVIGLGGLFARARKSAMSSVGWYVQRTLRNHLEYGPPEWEGLHDLTELFKKKGGMWALRTAKPRSPAFWLGKFSRYRVSSDGGWVQIDFGKSRKGQPGRFDPAIAPIARRIDQGEDIAVTPAMRRKMAATKKATRGQHEIGINYFPLRKSTKRLDIPARPIFAPVFRKIENEVTPLFVKKFWASFDRYQSGRAKA
jgi:hypothetical protein